MKDTIIVVDGNSLMNRAYYAIQRPMITKDGMFTQGIFGFLNMLNKILKDYKPSHIAVAFDRKAPTFRHEEYKEYKAGRKKMPPELAMEFPVLKEILEAMHIKILEIDGFEADDILGTVSLLAEEKNFSTYIITGDKDAFQLASDKTTVIFTKRGTSEFDAYDAAAVEEKYGFTPLQFIDFKGLMGDQSDNIPGIPGVGEKTATKLILEYGSVENMMAQLDSMKNSKLKDIIQENTHLAVMSKRLATINRYVPMEFDFDTMKYEEPDYERLIEIYKRLEFNSFIRKLTVENKNLKITESKISPTVTGQTGKDTEADIQPNTFTVFSFISENANIVHISEDKSLVDAYTVIKASDTLWLHVFHDNMHKGKPTISSVCLGVGDYLYCIHWQEEFAESFVDFLASYDGKICGHNLKDSYYSLISNNTVKAEKSKDHLFETGFDTAVAAYLVDPQKRSYELSVLMLEAFHKEFPSEKQIAEEASTIDLLGNTYDIQARLGLMILTASAKLVPVLSQQISTLGLNKVLEDIELPLIEVLADMESAGIKADVAVLNEIGDVLKERINELTVSIHEMAGEEFNINSPKQLGSILFEKMGLKGGKKTKTGYSTSADVLEKIVDDDPIISLILEYRMLTKLNSTYVDGMLPLIDSDGFIRAHFQQTVTTTGRLSCTEPNLQNIPVRQDLGRQFRKVFKASGDDRVLVGADYSQIELRVMAHLSEDEGLLESFANNNDIHTMTASRVFNVPVEDVTPLQRSRAKAVNFGVIYGISAFGLSEDLKISRAEAQNYINEYFKVHPKVKEYMDNMVKLCKENNYVTTITGRRRNISEIHSSNYMTRQLGERLAMNTPVQGSAADIIKIAMIRVYRALCASDLDARMILQVHDELIIDSSVEDKEKVSELLEECMNNALLLVVPLSAEVNIGSNWYELK